MDDELLYANEWNISAQYFYDKGYYSWMADKLNEYKTILEIGCGTGYSTLALIEKGYKVIAVDKNLKCIEQAQKLLASKGYFETDVTFFEGDIAVDEIRNELINKFKFDVVICWNVGSYWNQQMMEHYFPYMLEYGLNIQQISEDPESSYSELIIWNICRIAKAKGIAAHIVDRGVEKIVEETDPFFYKFRDEFAFPKIEYDNKSADSISRGGRMLTTNGIVNNESKIDMVFVSILYK